MAAKKEKQESLHARAHKMKVERRNKKILSNSKIKRLKDAGQMK